MKDEDKKAARAAFKERKSVAGIFAVKCRATGEIWVGQSANLGSVPNRLSFALRFGSDALNGLLDAWGTHGAESISIEELERLDEAETPYIRDALLKERAAHWREKLGAAQIWR